jgi:hypothetical protein
MRASIMRREHLDIEGVIAAVGVVFDAHIRELYVPVFVARQVMLERPRPHLLDVAIGTAIAVFLIGIPLLQKLLILALEIVLQDNAVDMRVVRRQPFRFAQICSVDLGVMRQLAWLLDAVVERLAVT